MLSIWRCQALFQPNERMQLTWLLGAPSRPASVHRCAVGQGGLGSSATQLMRAVSWRETAGVSSPNWRRSTFELPSRSKVVERQVVVGVRAGGLLEVHAARRLALVASRCAKARRTESRSLSSRPSRAVIESESRGAAQGLLERKASWAATCRRCAARGWRAGLGWRRRCESSLAAGPA